MDDEKPKATKQQICTIRIAFPVDTDEQAIAYKKKISDALGDNETAHIDFSITEMPANAYRSQQPNR